MKPRTWFSSLSGTVLLFLYVRHAARPRWVSLAWITLIALPLVGFQLPRSLATCPPACGLGFTVNTTFDAATGAGDAAPGNGVCETAPGNGVCTLRAAIEEANAYSSAHGGVTNGIDFNIPTTDPNYNGIFWTINLTGALQDLSTNINISGPGPDKLTVKPKTSGTFRIFNVTATGTVTFSGMTITKATPSGGDGGGILNGGGGTVNISNCIISANSAKHGGGISNFVVTAPGIVNLTNCTLSGNSAWGGGGGGIDNGGTVNLINSTISGNSAPINGGGIRNGGTLNLTNSTISGNFALGTHNNGGGISNEGSATANVTNCTISGNAAGNLGGGIYSTSTTTNVKSSVIALNTAGTSGPDVDGSFIGQGFNLIGKNDGAAASFPAGNPNANNDIVGTSASPVNPMLDPSGLQNNGGPTLTIALLSGSPAIDKGTSVGSTGTLTTDQRGVGYARTVDDLSVVNATGGNGTDVGAFEFGARINAASQKTHAPNPDPLKTFGIDLPLTGVPLGVECRRNTSADIAPAPNAGRDHEVVITFPRAVTVGGVSVTSNNTADTPTATSSVSSNIVTVDLHSIPNARRLTINLTSVSDGTNTNNVTLPMGILLGDVDQSGRVDGNDVSAVQSHTRQTLSNTTFQYDIDLTGRIDGNDVSTTQAHTRTSLP